jgi:two-component system nitrate/nitrite response regulator NarL
MRILIIDDSELVRRGIRQILFQEASWELCGEAGNGAEGVAKAKMLAPDVILLDMNLPAGSGLDTAAILKAMQPALKLVMMSQNDPRILREAATRAGADACLDKGMLASDLVPLIKSLWPE